MKDYYYEKLGKATLKLRLARIGYEREMEVLATKLLNTDSSMHGPIIDRINELRVAINELIEDAESYKAKYQAECDKEGAKDADIRK